MKHGTLKTISFCFILIVSPLSHAFSQEKSVDFRFAPPFWQSTICLPDDPFKTLVDEQGNLVIHQFPVNQYGEPRTRIGIEVTENLAKTGQALFSPRIPIVITQKQHLNLEVTEEAFSMTRIPEDELVKATPLSDEPEMDRGAGKEKPRNDMIIIRIRNNSNHLRTLKPVILVNSTLPVQFSSGQFILNNRERLGCTLPLDSASLAIKGQASRVTLKPVVLEPGQKLTFAVVLYGGGALAVWPRTTDEAEQCRSQAVSYWKSADLPYGRISVPDEGIQNLIDASIRNIWQSREIKNGLPAFQVGPTCYRGLWIVDGAFLLEAATILGTGAEARNGVKYNLSFQKEDGRFEVMEKYWKENGIITWTAVRHAMLTQDKPWLESEWPKLERAMAYIVKLREDSYKDDTPLNDGLMPAGTIDGGLSFGQEYTNVYWNLLGMKSFIQATRWLGKEAEAQKWEKIYSEFYSRFRETAKRDMLTDSLGNSYLPTLMGSEGAKTLPQRAQWSFCQAVYPGQLFDRKDPFADGNLKMLEATEREGMVYGTGWDAKGFWNYFASFYGHAWLWQGEGQKAANSLYAFANHASPLFAWREEQSPKGEPFKKVGDMPHNWASAEFIRLTVHLLALDRGTELHLLEGLPAEWTRPGMVTKLDGIATPFGPLTMELKIAANGKSATLKIEPLSDPGCTKIVVHTAGWSLEGEDISLEAGKGSKISVLIKSDK
jgi:hypothetical protein